MDIILNFAALRPVVAAKAPVLTLESRSDFQLTLADAPNGPQPLAHAVAAAEAFVKGRFVRRADDVAGGQGWLSLLAQLRDRPLPQVNELPGAIRRALQKAPPGAFAGDLERSRDSVVAAYLIEGGPDASLAADLVRIYSIAEALLSGTPSRNDLEAMLRGPLALPALVETLRTVKTTAAAAPTREEATRQLIAQVNGLARKRRQLATVLEDLSLHAEDELMLSELGEAQPLEALYRGAAASTTERPALAAVAAAVKPPVAPSTAIGSISPLLRASARQNVLLSARAVSLLPRETVQTLTALGHDPVATPIALIRNDLVRANQETGQQLLSAAGRLARERVAIDLGVHIDPDWILDPIDAPEQPPAVNVTAPATHVPVKPLGVADLLLVRAHISRYERSEVASIENVLAREKLTHTVRRLDSSETTTTAEQESTDLRTQTQTTAEEDKGHTTVQAVGPGLGPLAAEGPNSFAQSVTDQVSSSSSKRIRRVSTARQLRESEDTVEHIFDNAVGTAGSYGVYQFLDKVYQAQIFAYGTRLLYDLVVPEPAAMFREALSRPRSGLPLAVRPAPFRIAPTKLTLDNWAYYAAGHRATGVEAPPAREVVVTEPFGGKAKDIFSTDAATCSYVNAETRTTRIPRGYRAARYRVAVQATGFPVGWLQLIVGSKTLTIAEKDGTGPNGTYLRAGTLDGETDSLPVGLVVTAYNGQDYGVMTLAVGVEIICEASDELVTAWQVKAHGLILSANQHRFADYEEAIATRDAAARVFLQTLPAARKVTIVQTEMKRAALEVLTAQSFAGFNATRPDAMGFPFPDPAATAGLSAYIRFFEQAVEWEHLAYAFYPYLWGAQTSWVSKLLAAENNAQFAGFLTSGAARVVLPIRRNYEPAFERFLHTGLTPTTDELLDVGSPLWVSLVDDLQHRTADDWVEEAVGTPWEFRVASNLVRARPDGSMPKWTFASGTWNDAADPDF